MDTQQPDDGTAGGVSASHTACTKVSEIQRGVLQHGDLKVHFNLSSDLSALFVLLFLQIASLPHD